ncbi:MAG: hypothetical protein C0513_01100 [Isosphaera sp.]|nr:hypothetical protein [Isosphaera sp.]
MLHVLCPSRDGAAWALLAGRAASGLRGRHVAAVAGSWGDARGAHAAGLPEVVGLGSPRLAGLPAALRARRVARALRRRHGRAPVVLCWSSWMFGALHGVMPDARLTLVPSHLPAETWRSTGASVRCLVPEGSGVVTGLGEAAAQRVERLPMPDLDAGWEAQRARARAMLGAQGDEAVVGLLADPPSEGDARLFAWVMGMVHVSGERALGVASSGSWQTRRAARYLRLHKRDWDVRLCDGPALGWLPGCDIAVWGSDPGRVSGLDAPPLGGAVLARCAASAGVPVIAPRDPACDALLLGAAPWLLARGPTMLMLATALHPLVIDPAQRRAAGQALRRAVRDRGDSAGFLAALSRATGLLVRSPDQPPAAAASAL